MIRPLRIATPWDSSPLSAGTALSSAIVRNGSGALNVPANQALAAGVPYTTLDWVLCAGFTYFSLIAWCNAEVQVSAVPISAVTPTQQLDEVPWGVLVANQYYRVEKEMPGVYGFHLRFTSSINANIINVLELQLSSLS